MYSQKVPEYFLLGDLPKSFQDEVACALLKYSVALGCCLQGAKDVNIFGSGVLVNKDGHYGILTAHHCLHDTFSDFKDGSFNGNRLVIAFQRSHTIFPPEILIEHQLGIPKKKKDKPDEPGEPDLTFIEICECSLLSSIKGVNSFWPLDKNPFDVKPEFGRIEMPFCVNGYPGAYHEKITDEENKTIRQNLRHMSYFFVHGCESFSEPDEWDYVEAKDKKGDGLPSSFKGMSGGSVWGLRIKKHSDTKFELTGSCLIGINVWQIESGEDEISVRAHFIKSIYDTAWRNIQWRSPGIIVLP